MNERIVRQLIKLLKAFKHVVQIVQTGNLPSLYVVLIYSLTLLETLPIFDPLLNNNRENEIKTNNIGIMLMTQGEHLESKILAKIRGTNKRTDLENLGIR